MKKFLLATALAAVLVVPAVSAFAQSKVTVEVEAPMGSDIKKVNRGPAAGWANWCTVQNKGKPVVDASTCKSGKKDCSAICMVDGKKLDEPWKATAK